MERNQPFLIVSPAPSSPFCIITAPLGAFTSESGNFSPLDTMLAKSIV